MRLPKFSYGAIAESRETYRLATFGRIVALTRQAIVNDDLRAFDRAFGTAGMKASEHDKRPRLQRDSLEPAPGRRRHPVLRGSGPRQPGHGGGDHRDLAHAGDRTDDVSHAR